MECIYIKELSFSVEKYIVPSEECLHLKALRVQSQDKIMITNGAGLMAVAVVERLSKLDFIVNVVEYLENYGELDFRIGIAIGILNNKERFEFAIEKCIELGVYEVFPLMLDYSQITRINLERLRIKAVAAIKQSKRAFLPLVHAPITLANLLADVHAQYLKYQQLIVADEHGTDISDIASHTSSLVFIGSEGGFSEKEKKIFPNKTIALKLGNRRLRTETASILSVGLLSCER